MKDLGSVPEAAGTNHGDHINDSQSHIVMYQKQHTGPEPGEPIKIKDKVKPKPNLTCSGRRMPASSLIGLANIQELHSGQNYNVYAKTSRACSNVRQASITSAIAGGPAQTAHFSLQAFICLPGKKMSLCVHQISSEVSAQQAVRNFLVGYQ